MRRREAIGGGRLRRDSTRGSSLSKSAVFLLVAGIILCVYLLWTCKPEQFFASTTSTYEHHTTDIRTKEVRDISILPVELSEGSTYRITFWVDEGFIDFSFRKGDLVLSAYKRVNGRSYEYRVTESGSYYVVFENAEGSRKSVNYREEFTMPARTSTAAPLPYSQLIFGGALFLLFAASTVALAKSFAPLVRKRRKMVGSALEEKEEIPLVEIDTTRRTGRTP